VTGPHDDLPPGRLRRGRYLLTGRISVEQAHPTELAYATKHVLTHQEHLAGSADPFHRCREELALAELRMTLGDAPWRTFGSSALLAVTASLAPGECRRCRANLIARARGLSPPYSDEATDYLLGPGCARCRPSSRAVGTPVTASAGGSVRTRLRPLAFLRDDVNRLLREVGDGDPPRIPTLYDEPVHRDLRA
jgi:hypothetical protein